MARNYRSTNGGRGRGNGRNASQPRVHNGSSNQGWPSNSMNTSPKSIAGTAPLVQTPVPASRSAFSWASVAAGRPSTGTALPTPPAIVPVVPATNTEDKPKSNNSVPPTVAGPSKYTSYDQAPLQCGADKAMSAVKAKLDTLRLADTSQDQIKFGYFQNSVYRKIPRSQPPRQPTENRGPVKRNKWTKFDTRAGAIAKPKESGTKTEFKSLPPELRRNIWRLAMDVPRIIEMERGPTTRNGEDLMPTYGTHNVRRVTPLSCTVPALMHVCFESREQALQVYQKRTFDAKTSNGPQQDIYFNPKADILYFGDNTCLSTLIKTFTSSPRLDIPRVAINLTGRVTQCCHWDNDQWGVDGGISPMQSLHGFDENTTGHSAILGCPGLKEVFWITQSHLWELVPGEIHPALTSLRPATTDGLTKGQKNLKSRLNLEIANVESDIGLNGVGTNLWLDGNKPTFHFVSLAPHTKTEDMNGKSMIYDAMEVTQSQSLFLAKEQFKLIKNVRRRTNCYVFMPHKTFPGEGREIGFSGAEKEVAKAKQEIQELLENRGGADNP